MAIKIAFLNQKGGVGKTTNTINIGMALKLKGYEVLLVDSDPQGSLMDWNEESGGEVLPVIVLDRSSLQKDIKSIEKGKDIILIDGPAQSSQLAGAVVRTADFIVIPITPSPYDAWASNPTVETVKERIEAQESDSKTTLEPMILMTRARQGTTLLSEITTILEGFEIPILKNKTFQREIYPRSAASGKTVFCMSGLPAQKAQHEINLIAEEIVDRIETK